MKKAKSKLPQGWSQKQIQKLINHYENQTEDEAVAEDEAAYRNTRLTMMAVPVELVPKVQKLISKRAS